MGSTYDPNVGMGTTGLGTSGTGTGTTGLDAPETSTGIGTTGTGTRGRARQAKDKAAEVGRTAVRKIDEGMDTAASKLQGAASQIRNKVQGNSTMANVANRAADKMETAAVYMREHDAQDVMRDFEGAVRRNPGPSLIIAAAVGFLLGTTMRGGRGDRSYR